MFRAAGYPFVLTHAFDRRTPSHQCGTVRMGTDPATSALDVFCRTHDHANLFVVDAAFLPTSAAVNPSLTIAAQADPRPTEEQALLRSVSRRRLHDPKRRVLDEDV